MHEGARAQAASFPPLNVLVNVTQQAHCSTTDASQAVWHHDLLLLPRGAQSLMLSMLRASCFSGAASDLALN
jgi:hypothetical protein